MGSFCLIEKLLVLVGLWLLAGVAIAQPVLSEVHQVRRDYTGNYQATDSWHFYNTTAKQHHAVEFNELEPVQLSNAGEVVYRRGSTIYLTATWHHTGLPNQTLSGTMNWSQAKLVCPTNTLGVDETINLTVGNTSSQSVTLAPGGTWSTTLVLTNVPNYVAIGDLKVKYAMSLSYDGITYRGDSGSGLWQDWETVCLVDNQPQGVQAVPWTDFLYFSCRLGLGSLWLDPGSRIRDPWHV